MSKKKRHKAPETPRTPPWHIPPSNPLMAPGELREGHYARELAARQTEPQRPEPRPPAKPQIAPELDGRLVPGERWSAYYQAKQLRAALEAAERNKAAMREQSVDPRYVDPPTFSD
jgi:hypothetical protein